MLDFFRKYQRYLFIIITVVIIVSFSFFGTYNSIPSTHPSEQVVFHAVDGSSIKRSDVEEMAIFIGSDAFDKKAYGGMWGPNFLNDGVVANDFLKTGLAKILIEEYSPLLQEDLNLRLEREKSYSPYTHPEAKFLSVENAWNYFYPAMKGNFDQLKASNDPLSKQAVDARLQLYLNQREFPASIMRQILLQQQKQYNWLKEDPNLEYTDFSLFGYNSLEDWFGARFVRLLSSFIINTAKIAEQKGYKVSKDEALADLMRNAVISYNENAKNPYLGVTNASDYYAEQLRRLGMDQNKAVKVWQQVMLFRRLLDDVSNTVLNDSLTMEGFNQFAQQKIAGNVYKLPKELQINDFRQLQKFETYLNAATKRNNKDLLAIPDQFMAVEEVLKNTPELVQKKYLVEIASVGKGQLQSKIGVKETWNWEIQEGHWEKLKKQFPELGLKKAETKEDRFKALDSLDDKTRSRVDTYARSLMVDSNPDLIGKTLDQVPLKRQIIGLHPKGKNKQFPGLDNPETLIQLLDKAPLNELSHELNGYTPDQSTFYRIKVIERLPNYQVYTFAEADEENVLDDLLDKQLESYYKKVRDSHPDLFQNDLKAWKPFSEVKTKTAELYFADLIEAIKQDYMKTVGADKAPKTMLSDYAASLRFYSYMNKALNQLKKDPAAESQWVVKKQEEAASLNDIQALSEQWKLKKEELSLKRAQADKMQSAFDLDLQSWTHVLHSANGELSFFEVTEKGTAPNDDLHKKLNEVQAALGDEAQQLYTKKILEVIKNKKAIELDYLNYHAEPFDKE